MRVRFVDYGIQCAWRDLFRSSCAVRVMEVFTTLTPHPDWGLSTSSSDVVGILVLPVPPEHRGGPPDGFLARGNCYTFPLSRLRFVNLVVGRRWRFKCLQLPGAFWMVLSYRTAPLFRFRFMQLACRTSLALIKCLRLLGAPPDGLFCCAAKVLRLGFMQLARHTSLAFLALAAPRGPSGSFFNLDCGKHLIIAPLSRLGFMYLVVGRRWCF